MKLHFIKTLFANTECKWSNTEKTQYNIIQVFVCTCTYSTRGATVDLKLQEEKLGRSYCS